MKLLRRKLTIAIGSSGIWVRRPGLMRRGKPEHIVISDTDPNGAPQLRTGLAAYMSTRGVRHARADVVLMPPLIAARVIELPRLSSTDCHRVISRSPERYLSLSREAHVVATRRILSRGPRTRVLVAAVPLRIAQHVESELAAAGITLRTMTCAHEHWVSALRPRPRRQAVIAASGDEAELIETSGPRIDRISRLHTSGLQQTDLRELGGVLLVAQNPESVLSFLNLRRNTAVSKLPEIPGAAAARLSGRRNRLVFRTPNEVIRLERRRWLATAAALLVAVGLLGGSVVLELGGQRAQLAAVRAARQAVRPRLERALAAQHAARTSTEELKELQALEREAHRWSRVISRVAVNLPLDSRLVSLRASIDSVRIEGFGDDPHGAYLLLREAGIFDTLLVASPVSRVRTASNVPTLRFTFLGRIAGGGSS